MGMDLHHNQSDRHPATLMMRILMYSWLSQLTSIGKPILAQGFSLKALPLSIVNNCRLLSLFILPVLPTSDIPLKVA
jgi:hypothetical protein